MLYYLICLNCLLLTLIAAHSVKRNGAEEDNSSEWHGSWFPFPPGVNVIRLPLNNKNLCDNGEYEIHKDFDPKDKRHAYNYLCMDNRTAYEPSFNRSPVLTESFIPPAYAPIYKCLNETIIYKETIPTYGPFRPLAPKYGTYLYLPPTRYLRSLVDGAIVLLYHPCANAQQLRLLENSLQGCLYRHIITPSSALPAERPLALLAWGKSLLMSVVDDRTVVEFIKEHAKLTRSFKHTELSRVTTYEAGLLTEAHLVTDENDTVVCGYKEM